MPEPNVVKRDASRRKEAVMLQTDAFLTRLKLIVWPIFSLKIFPKYRTKKPKNLDTFIFIQL